jgi:hypothetical protein
MKNRTLLKQRAGKFEVDVDGIVTNATKTKTKRWWQFGKRNDGEGGGLGGLALAAGALPLVASLFVGGSADYDDGRVPGSGGVPPAALLSGVSCVAVCCCIVVIAIGAVMATAD